MTPSSAATQSRRRQMEQPVVVGKEAAGGGLRYAAWAPAIPLTLQPEAQRDETWK